VSEGKENEVLIFPRGNASCKDGAQWTPEVKPVNSRSQSGFEDAARRTAVPGKEVWLAQKRSFPSPYGDVGLERVGPEKAGQERAGPHFSTSARNAGHGGPASGNFGFHATLSAEGTNKRNSKFSTISDLFLFQSKGRFLNIGLSECIRQ